MIRFLLFLLIPFTINAQVYTQDQWVNFYLRDCNGKSEKYACRQHLEKTIGRMIAYKNLVTTNLNKAGLPQQFSVLPAIESTFKDKAESNKGALGLWQIMPYNIKKYRTRNIVRFGRKIKIEPTTKKVRQYGLNPVSNTHIAIEHLTFLYGRFKHDGDTEKLVVMAYNCGRRCVNNWLSGKSDLPEETQNYYNRYKAVNHIIKNAKIYKIKPVVQNRFLMFEHLKDLVSIELDEEFKYIERIS